MTASLAWTDAMTMIYALSGLVRLLAYLPQIAKLRGGGRADGISVGAWVVFAIAHATTLLYALQVSHDRLLATMSALNALGSLAVALLAWHRQRADPPCIVAAR